MANTNSHGVYNYGPKERRKILNAGESGAEDRVKSGDSESKLKAETITSCRDTFASSFEGGEEYRGPDPQGPISVSSDTQREGRSWETLTTNAEGDRWNQSSEVWGYGRQGRHYY